VVAARAAAWWLKLGFRQNEVIGKTRRIMEITAEGGFPGILLSCSLCPFVGRSPFLAERTEQPGGAYGKGLTTGSDQTGA